MNPVILVIDDEEAIRLFLEATLSDHGYDVLSAGTGEEALATLAHRDPDLVLLDLMLPDMSGIQVLDEIKQRLPHVNVLMITAYSGTETAVRAMQLDAFDYITKPIELDHLLHLIDKALEVSATARASHRERSRQDIFATSENVVPSRAPAMKDLYEVVRKVAASDASTVLIEGESGVGKDVLADMIHRSSLRAEARFTDINCAALPETLLESELFGHEKGAFTDAVAQKPGLLEVADGGTVFLDEIGEMGLASQVKLLKVLERRSFRRLGGVKDIAVDVRIIAATNRNLATQVERGTFREDLYYRLQVVPLSVPPLRRRREDILPLAEHFLAEFNVRFSKSFDRIAPEAARLLEEHPWPGNIRQLRNAMERSVLLEDGKSLLPEHLHLVTRTPDAGGLAERLAAALDGDWGREGVPLEELVASFESNLVRRALEAAEGNQSRAARLLHLNRDKFRYRLKQYGDEKS